MATFSGKGRRHDFYLYKISKLPLQATTKIIADSGYQGIQKLHINSSLPKKKTKANPLSVEDKKLNKANAAERVSVENIIRVIKIFKILSDRYRNRRKRFNLRFNLISGFYNYEL